MASDVDVVKVQSCTEQLCHQKDSITMVALDNTSEVIVKLQEQVTALKESLIEISAKFDAWQSHTDSISKVASDAAKTAMDYQNFILGVTALVITVAGIGFSYWLAKSKKDAVDDAINTIEKTIARGILPENSDVRSKIIKTIINSEEFIDAVKRATEFHYNSCKEEDSKQNKSRSTVALGLGDINEAKDNSTADQ